MSECRFVAKIAKRFLITVPKPVREVLELREGDVVEVILRVEKKYSGKN